MIGNLTDIIDEQIGIGRKVVTEPILKTGERIAVKGKGRRDSVRIVIALGAIIYAVSGKQDSPRVDQGTRANETVIPEKLTNAVYAINRIADVLRGEIIIGHNSLSWCCKSERSNCPRCCCPQKYRSLGLSEIFVHGSNYPCKNQSE